MGTNGVPERIKKMDDVPWLKRFAQYCKRAGNYGRAVWAWQRAKMLRSQAWDRVAEKQGLPLSGARMNSRQRRLMARALARTNAVQG